MTTVQKKAAFQCQTGSSEGQPHQWSYLKDLEKNYRCQLCLVLITKAELKRLTDNA